MPAGIVNPCNLYIKKKRMELKDSLDYLWRNPEEFDIDEFLVLIGREELLGAEDERMLIEQAQRDGGVSADSSRAMSRLKCRMLRFVVSLVRQYQNQGLSLQTLIKAGLIGLERAVMDYEVSSEEKFLHFAVPLMRKVLEYCIGIGGLPKPQGPRKLKITKSVTNRDVNCEENSDSDGDVWPHKRIPLAFGTILLFSSSKKREDYLSTEHCLEHWHDAITELANHAMRKMEDIAVHFPDGYDEREKNICTVPYFIEDAAYSGECKNFVKSKNAESECLFGDWHVCPVGAEPIPVAKLTDKKALRRIVEALLSVIDGITEWKKEQCE